MLQDIKLGRLRAEALKALAQRIETPELSSFVRTMVQADRMGTPIADALAVHAEDIRLQRYLRAERAALKAPIKILIPLILFILPCVFLPKMPNARQHFSGIPRNLKNFSTTIRTPQA